MRLLLALMATFSLTAFADGGYPACYVADGKAHALFCAKSSDSGSGTGSVIAFDKNGREVFSDNIVIWVGIAIMGCDEVATLDVPDDAVGCIFSLEN